jgi:hypothetical protein
MDKPQYRIWYVTNIPNEPVFEDVESPETGAKRMKVLIEEQLQDSSIESNAFGLEEYYPEFKDWGEWYNDMGEDVLEAFNL